jgi:hypothetical protein
MSVKFHQTTELSTEDFAAFDDMLLEENSERGFKHLFLLDHLMAVVHGRGQLDGGFHNRDLTVKYYARKVLRHVRHRLLHPRIGTFMECEEVTSINTPSHRLFLFSFSTVDCLDLSIF